MGPTFDEIVTALGSSDESERCYAIEDLQQEQPFIGSDKIIPYLITAIQDRSVRVREAATDFLAKMGGPTVAEATGALLSSEDASLRNAAIEVLEKLGPSALTELEKHFTSPSADIRKFAIDTVGKILNHSNESSPGVFSGLLERLADENVNVAAAAAEALGFARDEAAIPVLLNYISGPRQASWLQCNVIVALSRISGEKSLKAILEIDARELSREAKDYLEMALNGGFL